jgi:hypothetical protein
MGDAELHARGLAQPTASGMAHDFDCTHDPCRCVGRRQLDSSTRYIEPRTIDEARLQMVAMLHEAMWGDVWARPEPPETVWADLLERVRTASQAFHR